MMGAPVLDVVRLRTELEAHWQVRETRPARFGQWTRRLDRTGVMAPGVPIAMSGYDQKADTDNPYWEIVRLLPCSYGHSPDFAPHLLDMPDLPLARYTLTMMFAWAIPSPAALAWIVQMLDDAGMPRRLVEVCAGTGYWAWQLRQMGVQVDATDDEPGAQLPPGSETIIGRHLGAAAPLWAPVQAMDAAEAAAAAGPLPLLMVWPPYDDPTAHDVLNAYTGDMLFLCGEPSGGCTGDDAFFDLLYDGWFEAAECDGHVHYDGLHDNLILYRRKGAR